METFVFSGLPACACAPDQAKPKPAQTVARMMCRRLGSKALMGWRLKNGQHGEKKA
jgi:hypothetical protein